jgi:SAM-dependent methyltransferase
MKLRDSHEGIREGGKSQGLLGERSLDWIRRVFVQGGPEPDAYARVDAWVAEMADGLRSGRVSRESLDSIWQSFGSSYLSGTLQGRAFAQPCGYAGDFETIDHIYRQAVSDDPRYSRWDRYFHAQAAPRAVRNRKEYFKTLVRRTENRASGPVHVLNLGSGPCRDVLEYFDDHPESRVCFTCVDQDSDAIGFARSLCGDHGPRVGFTQANALRFRSSRRFDLVWSGGVMDYLDDRIAKMFLRRALTLVAPGGEVAIGNFSMDNPSQDYMEVVGRWYLHHRSQAELFQLAIDAGAEPHNIRTGMEVEGVNLFLHLLNDRSPSRSL